MATTATAAATGCPQQEALPSMTKGAYNANAKVQRHAIESALGMLEEAANSIPITPGKPVQILELGCSQGVNSMQPIKTILQALASRAHISSPSTVKPASSDDEAKGVHSNGGRLEVVVTHEDLPSNDFESLFGLIGDKEKTYVPQDPHFPLDVYPSAVGRSCYERLLPSASVHLVFSYNTLHWMSRKPAMCSDSLFIYTSKDQDVIKAYAQQSLLDLINVLQLRAAEVVPGGFLQAVVPVTDPASDKSWALRTMLHVTPAWVAEGKLTAEEVGAVVIPVYTRTEEEVEAALNAVGQLWVVKSSFVRETQGPTYTRFTAGELTAAEYGQAMRSQMAAVIQGYMTSQLAQTRGPEVAEQMVSDLLDRYQAALAQEPEEASMQTMYLSLQRTKHSAT